MRITTTVLFLLATSSGAFAQTFKFLENGSTNGNIPYGMAVGDFNGDGRADVAISPKGTYFNTPGIMVFLSNADGSAQPAEFYPGSLNPFDFAVADIDGDGDLDLVTANRSAEFYPVVGLSIFYNDGAGHFVEGFTISGAGVGGDSVATGDFDQDGKLDIAVSRGFPSSGIRIYRQENGQFAASQDLNSFSPTDIVVKDVDGDGRADIVSTVSVPNNNFVQVHKNLGGGLFAVVSAKYPVPSDPEGLALADLNGDGSADAAIACSQKSESGDGLVAVLLNDGAGSFSTLDAFPAGKNSYDVVAKDLDGDHVPDLAVANYASNDISIFRNLGNGNFSLVQTVGGISGGAYRMDAGDFDADGDLDLAISNAHELAVTRLKNVTRHKKPSFLPPSISGQGQYTTILFGGVVIVIPLASGQGALQED